MIYIVFRYYVVIYKYIYIKIYILILNSLGTGVVRVEFTSNMIKHSFSFSLTGNILAHMLIYFFLTENYRPEENFFYCRKYEEKTTGSGTQRNIFSMFKIWECNCRSWPGASEPRTPISRQCFDILVPLVLDTSRRRRSGTAEGKRWCSSVPEEKFIDKFAVGSASGIERREFCF